MSFTKNAMILDAADYFIDLSTMLEWTGLRPQDVDDMVAAGRLPAPCYDTYWCPIEINHWIAAHGPYSDKVDLADADDFDSHPF